MWRVRLVLPSIADNCTKGDDHEDAVHNRTRRARARGGAARRAQLRADRVSRGDTTIFGSPGDDALTGTDESDVIVGLGGNDVIDAGDEADLVCGGPGNDRILTGDDGFLEPDVVSGDEGDDLIAAGSSDVFAVYMTATGPVSVDLGPGTATGAAGNDTLLGVVGVIGSEFDDTLRGNARSNLLAGMGGNDT